MRTARVTRVLRGTLAAGVATFVALLSHVIGGGAMPSGIGILLPLVLSLAVCTLLAGRRLSAWRLALAVGASQFLFHALFVLGTFAPSTAAQTPGHHHGAATLAPAADAATAVSLGHADTAMWAGHVAAALVTTLLLYRGEQAARRLAALAVELVGRVRRLLVAVARITPTRGLAQAAVEVDLPVWTSVFLSPSRRRGPPSLRVV